MLVSFMFGSLKIIQIVLVQLIIITVILRNLNENIDYEDSILDPIIYKILDTISQKKQLLLILVKSHYLRHFYLSVMKMEYSVLILSLYLNRWKILITIHTIGM